MCELTDTRFILVRFCMLIAANKVLSEPQWPTLQYWTLLL